MNFCGGGRHHWDNFIESLLETSSFMAKMKTSVKVLGSLLEDLEVAKKPQQLSVKGLDKNANNHAVRSNLRILSFTSERSGLLRGKIFFHFFTLPKWLLLSLLTK
jgi:hypothetical protein